MKIQKQKIYGKEYLANPQKCFKFADQFAYSKFMCLNKCYIELNLSLALDLEKKNQLLDLRSIRRLKTHKNPTNKDILKTKNSKNLLPPNLTGFRYCLKRCQKTEDCFQETYNVIRLGEAYSKTLPGDQIQVDLEATIYLAYFSTTDFFLQFFGLLTRKTLILLLLFFIISKHFESLTDSLTLPTTPSLHEHLDHHIGTFFNCSCGEKAKTRRPSILRSILSEVQNLFGSG